MKEVNAEETMMKPSSTELKGLIVKKPFIDLILRGKKRVEIRKQKTKHRGKVVLLWRGLAYGTVEIVDVIEVNPEDYPGSEEEREFLREYSKGRKLFGWVLRNPVRFREPVPLKVKRGAQTWVRIVGENARKVLEAEHEALGEG